MTTTARFYRTVTAAALVLYAALCFVFAFTRPPRDDSGAIIVEGIAPMVSAYAFLGAQAALIVGAVGIAHLLRGRVTVLSALAAALLLVGAVCHAAYCGIALIELSAVTAAAREAIQVAMAGPALPVSVIAMIGTVVGTVVLAVALFRAGRATWWIGGALLAWVATEFFLSGLGTWVGFLSGALLLAAFAGLAVVTLKSPVEQWMTAVEAARMPALV